METKVHSGHAPIVFRFPKMDLPGKLFAWETRVSGIPLLKLVLNDTKHFVSNYWLIPLRTSRCFKDGWWHSLPRSLFMEMNMHWELIYVGVGYETLKSPLFQSLGSPHSTIVVRRSIIVVELNIVLNWLKPEMISLYWKMVLPFSTKYVIVQLIFHLQNAFLWWIKN